MHKTFLTLCLLSMLLFSCQNYGNQNNSPSNFKVNDLVGRWKAVYGNNRVDNLIIKENGTYKQIYSEPNGYNYEGSWNKWYIEYGNKNKIYLHLENMVFFPLGREWSQNGSQNLFSDIQPFYNPDEDTSVKMINEIILRIHWVEGRWAPRNLILVHMVTDPDMGGDYFVLQE